MNTTFATTLKKVLLLDIKNIDQLANYQYLEGSITDATEKLLRKEFAYRATPRNKWQEIAEKNYILKEDLYTGTAALNLGLLSRQDVVIAGGFKVRQVAVTSTGAVTKKKKRKKKRKKKNASTDSVTGKTTFRLELSVTIRIYDIAKRKIIATIKESSPVDASLFTAIDRIATRIANEAKKILPNKEQWKKTGVPLDEEEATTHTLRLISSMSVFDLPASTNNLIATTTAIYPDDIKSSLFIGAEYNYNGFTFLPESLFAWGRGLYHLSQADFAVEKNTQSAKVKSSGILASGGAGYRYFIYKGLYASTLLGGGFYMGNVSIDYSALPNKPLDSLSGSELGTINLNTSAPAAQADLRIGYQITRSVSLEIGATYTHLFYLGHQSGFVQAQGGLGVHF